MAHSHITNTVYKFILLAAAILLVVVSVSSFWEEVSWFYIAYFFINSLVLTLYYYKSSLLKKIVRLSAIVILLHALTASYPVVLLGFLYGMGPLWKVVPFLLVMPALGVYLYWGSNRYIELTTSDNP